MEEFGLVFNRLITERNPPGHQELETLSASSPTPTPTQVTEPSSPTQTSGHSGMDHDHSMNHSPMANTASGALTNTWPRIGVVFTLGIYSVLAAINS